MHCCASSAAKEEALIPWTRDPSGRLQSRQKSEFRRTTDLPCHVSTVQIGARSGKTGSSSIYRQPFKGELWYGRSDQAGQSLRSHCFSLSPFRTVRQITSARCLCEQCRSVSLWQFKN